MRRIHGAILLGIVLAFPAAAQDGFQSVRPSSGPARPPIEPGGATRSARPETPPRAERPSEPAAPREDLAQKCRRLVQERYPSGTLSRSRNQRAELEANCVANGGTVR